MQNKSVSVLALLAAIAAGALFTPHGSALAASYGEAFWRCGSGYTFETSGSAVHCKKPEWTEMRAFMPCALATPALKIDLIGLTDMCAGSTPITGTVSMEPACYPTDLVNGFTKRKVDGKDYCGRNHPAEIVAPSQMISL